MPGPDPRELRKLRSALVHARGRRKLDVILDAPDPAALVHGLPAQDLYFAAADIGLDDAGPLVRLARPAQFRTFVDLDAWRGGELDPARVATWLELARGDDDEGYRAKLEKLDIEVLELVLRASVQVYDLEEEEPPDIAGASERSPDGRFLLVYPEGPVPFTDARRLVAELYERDPFQAARLLSAVRWELTSELTETALRWRDARLADLGFPSPSEAASLYARAPRVAPARPEPPREPAGFFLAELERGNVLDRALAALPDVHRERLERELVAVLNMAIVADAVDVSDLGAVRAEAAAVRDTVALGLARLGEPASRLELTPLKAIFQAGFTATLELRWRLDRLLAALPLRLPDGELLVDPPDDALVRALLARRPRFAGPDGVVRPFADAADLAAGSAALDRVETAGKMLAAAGLDVAALSRELVRAQGEAALAVLHASDVLATAAARTALGISPAVGLLPGASLDAAVQRLLDRDGHVRGEVAAFLRGLGREADPAAAASVVERVIARIEAELGPQLASGGVDPVAAAPLLVEP